MYCNKKQRVDELTEKLKEKNFTVSSLVRNFGLRNVLLISSRSTVKWNKTKEILSWENSELVLPESSSPPICSPEVSIFNK